MEGDIISRQHIAFQSIPAAGLHGVGLVNLPGNLSRLLRGYLKARKIIRVFDPDVLFFTGGYLAVPAAYAGRSVPSLVFMPDIEPGLAIKTISQLADRIAVSVEQSRDYLPSGKPVVVSGYPVRSDLLGWTKEQALRALDLSPDRPVLLAFGGSKGARSLNRALVGILPELLDDIQVVQITGTLDWEEIRSSCSRLTQRQAANYRGFPFLHEEMGAALRAADLAVSRSGASILGEYPLFGLPSSLLSELLLPRVRALLGDRDRLAEMGAAMSRLARPDAARDIAQELLALAGEDPGGFRE